MMDYGWGMSHSFGWVFVVLLWVLIVLGIVAIARWLFSASVSSAAPQSKTALEILSERYARGEIGKEEYDQKRRDIER